MKACEIYPGFVLIFCYLLKRKWNTDFDFAQRFKSLDEFSTSLALTYFKGLTSVVLGSSPAHTNMWGTLRFSLGTTLAVIRAIS